MPTIFAGKISKYNKVQRFCSSDEKGQLIKMKQIILCTSVLISLLSTAAFSQGVGNAIHIYLPVHNWKVQQPKYEKGDMQIKSEQVIISRVTMREGTNTITVTGGRGTLTFMKKNEFFSNVLFTDAAGKTSRLVPNNGNAGIPKPVCQFPIPDASFGTAGNIGLSICRASGFAGISGSFTISLLLPVVQKIRST